MSLDANNKYLFRQFNNKKRNNDDNKKISKFCRNIWSWIFVYKVDGKRVKEIQSPITVCPIPIIRAII